MRPPAVLFSAALASLAVAAAAAAALPAVARASSAALAAFSAARMAFSASRTALASALASLPTSLLTGACLPWPGLGAAASLAPARSALAGAALGAGEGSLLP